MAAVSQALIEEEKPPIIKRLHKSRTHRGQNTDIWQTKYANKMKEWLEKEIEITGSLEDDSLGPGNPSRELDSLQDCQPQDKRNQKRRMGINDRRRKKER